MGCRDCSGTERNRSKEITDRTYTHTTTCPLYRDCPILNVCNTTQYQYFIYNLLQNTLQRLYLDESRELFQVTGMLESVNDLSNDWFFSNRLLTYFISFIGWLTCDGENGSPLMGVPLGVLGSVRNSGIGFSVSSLGSSLMTVSAGSAAGRGWLWSRSADSERYSSVKEYQPQDMQTHILSLPMLISQVTFTSIMDSVVLEGELQAWTGQTQIHPSSVQGCKDFW